MRLDLSMTAVVLLATAAFAADAPKGDAAKGFANFERIGCYQCHGHQGQGGREGPRIADPVPLAWPAFLAWVRTTSGAESAITLAMRRASLRSSPSGTTLFTKPTS